MAVWYLSVGIRLAVMFTSHLPPHNYFYQLFNVPPLTISDQPTVDRTMQALRLRSGVIFIMTIAEVYAIILRFILWSENKLNEIQQEMAIKNVLFVVAAYTAYSLYMSSINRDWNSRELGFGIKIPNRIQQHRNLRIGFAFTYLLLGAMLSSFLIEVASIDRFTWTCNVATDFLLVSFFLIYCKNVHIKRLPTGHGLEGWKSFILPEETYLNFPGWLGTILGIILAGNMYLARLPALYYNFSNMNDDNTWTNYDNALLLISISIIPIAFYAQYWSISYMLYNKEFTACPGNYNSIHDPIISMVAMSTITEGALDILSCSTFMALAANNLPNHINGAIVLFCILEIINGCTSFALQVVLSGGKGDTPTELIGWKSIVRGSRGIIDLGCFILRMILWINYHAVSSVFLIKNLYNLVHAFVEVERAIGIKYYPKGTLFTEFVPPSEWYGLSQAQWRVETSETIADQARAGRKV